MRRALGPFGVLLGMAAWSVACGGPPTPRTTTAAETSTTAQKNDDSVHGWVARLDEPSSRAAAIRRLCELLDDELMRSQGNANAAGLRALANETAAPLTKTYVEHYAELEKSVRVSLIKHLTELRDERTVPALEKAFTEFVAHPKATSDEADIKWAVRAYGDLKTPSLAPAVLAAFEKLEAHTMLGAVTYRDFGEAMVKAPSPSWSPTLLRLIAVPMADPSAAKTKDEAKARIDAFRDQLFWQVVGSQVLGELGDAKAVEPLLQVLLSPSKQSLGTTALLALVRIGKPSVEASGKLLDGSSPALVAYYENALKEAGAPLAPAPLNVPRMIAAAVLGMSGRSDAAPPLLRALRSPAFSPEDKAMAARELSKLPATQETVAAFRTAFETLPYGTAIAGVPAHILLAESATAFYDSSLVPWLLQRETKLKGRGAEQDAIRDVLFTSALKLARAEQLDSVGKAIQKRGSNDVATLLEKAVRLSVSCKDNVDCYLLAVSSRDFQAHGEQFYGMRAAYMIGVLGDATARDRLIERLGAVQNPAVRFVAAQTIDHLTPQGSPEIAARLDAIIVKDKKSGDMDKVVGNAPLQQVSYRLVARGR
jgi:hypothetical protein